MITVPPFDPMPPLPFYGFLILQQATVCKKYVDWWSDKLFIPISVPNPPSYEVLQGPDNLVTKHLWELFISNAEPEESLIR